MSSVLTNVGASVAAATGQDPTGWLVRIDPRVRILAAAGFAVSVVACDSFGVLLAALTAAFALLAASGLPLRRTLRRMAAMDGFILFMLLMLPFTMPGAPMFSVWGLTASWDGLWQALRIALTANAVILALMTLVGSMEPVTLGHALHALHMPRHLVHLLMFTVRYIDVLREEYLRLRLAMRARGFQPAARWHCYRSFGFLIGMMLVRSIERSERILDAMKCRGFTGHMPLLETFAFRARDMAFAGGFGLLLAALIAGEVLHGAV